MLYELGIKINFENNNFYPTLTKNGILPRQRYSRVQVSVSCRCLALSSPVSPDPWWQTPGPWASARPWWSPSLSPGSPPPPRESRHHRQTHLNISFNRYAIPNAYVVLLDYAIKWPQDTWDDLSKYFHLN